MNFAFFPLHFSDKSVTIIAITWVQSGQVFLWRAAPQVLSFVAMHRPCAAECAVSRFSGK